MRTTCPYVPKALAHSSESIAASCNAHSRPDCSNGMLLWSGTLARRGRLIALTTGTKEATNISRSDCSC